MTDKCCDGHPRGCPVNAAMGWGAVVAVAFGFGWRWAALFVCVSCSLDWLIRVWHHARRNGGA